MSLRELPPLEESDDALLRELAAMAPVPDAAFAARLDARVERGFAAEPEVDAGPAPVAPAPRASGRRRRGRRLALRVPRPGPLALGSLATILLVVVATVVFVGHDRGGTSETITTLSAVGEPPTAADQAAAPAAPAPAAGVPSGAAASSGGRAIARDTTLTVTAASGRFDAAAARVPQIVAAAGGTVASSVVAAGSVGDEGTFSLRVPSARYASVMAQLSALGRVTRRTEQTEDVTAASVSADDRLGDLRAERDSVRRRLAATIDDARALRLRDQLASLRRQVADQRAAAAALHQRARVVPIQLGLQGRRAGDDDATADASDDDRGAIAQALHDAGRILTSAGAVAIVVLAVAVPLGLVLALVWRGAGLLRRRRREQGLKR
jgi:hypothetical protein